MATQTGHGTVAGKRSRGSAKSKSARTGGAVKRSAKTGKIAVHDNLVLAVMTAAKRSGLLQEKSGRIAGRVSPELVRKAKARTGIATDTDLIEFALASVALEDTFAESFKAVRGTVDPDLNLGF